MPPQKNPATATGVICAIINEFGGSGGGEGGGRRGGEAGGSGGGRGGGMWPGGHGGGRGGEGGEEGGGGEGEGGGGEGEGGAGVLTMPYERTGRSERTTKCCSSSCSAGVKQLMSVQTARRTIRPDVGEPSGTLAVTITLVPRCSISISCSISSARPPAPQARMAASSALLGSAPTSVSFLCRFCDDGHFVGTPPPSKLALKVMRSMGACVGSNGTSGAPSTGQRSRRTFKKRGLLRLGNFGLFFRNSHAFPLRWRPAD